jgi:hypothetical protein
MLTCLSATIQLTWLVVYLIKYAIANRRLTSNIEEVFLAASNITRFSADAIRMRIKNMRKGGKSSLPQDP